MIVTQDKRFITEIADECPKCGGVLKNTGETLDMYPCVYAYRCQSCGHLESTTSKQTPNKEGEE